MFYSNNNGYMDDLYYYNQMPNVTYMNTLGNNMMGSANMQVTHQGVVGMPNNQTFANQGMFSGGMQIQNLNNLYPSIYRILNPVISRVVLNNNQPITDELLNNMTDTVFNIVEGQIDLGDDQTQRNNHNDSQQLSANNSNSVSSNRTTEQTRQNNSQLVQNNSSRNNRSDLLLRDLIKILIIKELLSRNVHQRQYRK